MVACHPLPQDLALWGNLDKAVIFEFSASNIWPRTIRMRQNQRIATLNRGLECRRIIAGRKIVPLPVMMLARGPYGFSIVCCDLFAVVKSPYKIAFEVALDKLERFLVRRMCPIG